jgi:REP element-mobilizing transposase RayT
MKATCHLGRPPRIQLFQNVRPFYFITFNSYRRRPILASGAFHDAFLSFARIAHLNYSVGMGRYVIMPDHVHFFVVLPEHGIRLTHWIQALRSVTGKSLLREGIGKPHWQSGFFDHVMRSAESYGEKWNYVRQNPIRAGLVADAEDWPYQGEVVPLRF